MELDDFSLTGERMSRKNSNDAGSYDAAAISLLSGLEPVRRRGPTILNGADLEEREVEVLCSLLAGNAEVWRIEVTDLKGRKTSVVRER